MAFWNEISKPNPLVDRCTRERNGKRGCAKEKARDDILCMAEIKDRSLVRALNITAGTGEHGTVGF